MENKTPVDTTENKTPIDTMENKNQLIQWKLR